MTVGHVAESLTGGLKMKYLYYRGRYTDRSVYRSIVTRETEHNYWIKAGHTETKISKKTMSNGDTWSKTY